MIGLKFYKNYSYSYVKSRVEKRKTFKFVTYSSKLRKFNNFKAFFPANKSF